MIKREQHNYVGTPTYGTWYNMKSRCDNPTYTNYHKWGGRGITYNKRWLSFLNFLEDMGERPVGMSLDRIDNNGNYTKLNCRWATRKEQMNNMSSNRLITYKDTTRTLQEWADFTGLKRETISKRIDSYGYNIEEALFKKLQYND